MKLSFIVVSYNEREYLEQAVQSCLDQNVEDSEIIIADDGSDDGSIELIKELAQRHPKKIRYIIHDRSDVVPGKIIPPIRVSNGIKRALAIAKGRYCQMLSGDDFFYPGSFTADAVKFLDENPEYSAYVGGHAIYYPDRPGSAYWAFYPKSLFWTGDYVHISAFVYRRELFEKGGFLPRFCDDTGLHYSLLVSGKWYYAKDLVIGYRQRGGSIMHEADRLELYVLELMLMQDVLEAGKMPIQTRIRYARPMRYVFWHRERLSNPKYAKYLENCAQYPKNILGEIAGYDQASFLKKIKTLLKISIASLMRVVLVAMIYGIRVIRKIRKIILGIK